MILHQTSSPVRASGSQISPQHELVEANMSLKSQTPPTAFKSISWS